MSASGRIFDLTRSKKAAADALGPGGPVLVDEGVDSGAELAEVVEDLEAAPDVVLVGGVHAALDGGGGVGAEGGLERERRGTLLFFFLLLFFFFCFFFLLREREVEEHPLPFFASFFF